VEASAHYIVKDSEVLQAIPTDEVAWHCGSKGNYSSIGIEVIPASYNGMFSTASIDTLRSLLLLLPKVPLKRHYDWTGKDCPRYYTPMSEGGEERWKWIESELLKQ
jgi:N-acetylmuramoyl-L-alanine amidase